MRHDSVPDLRRAAQVGGAGGAIERAFEGGAEVVGLQLDGGEADRAFGQMGDAAIAGGGIGQGDDAAGVQIAVGGQQGRLDRQLGLDLAAVDGGDDDAQMAGQVGGTALVELFGDMAQLSEAK